MAEKKKSSSSSNGSGTSFNKVMDAMAFIAVCFGGIALFAAFILGKLGISLTLVSILSKLANIIGCIVLCLLSGKYIKSKKKIWMWVIWAIALVMIIVFTILV